MSKPFGINTADHLAKEALIKCPSVIPAKAGIQEIRNLDPGIRRGDDLIRASQICSVARVRI
jgi:hypothetical protein